MEAEIAGRDEDGLGVRVIDNDGIEHRIAMDWDGNIKQHGFDSDVYPHGEENRTDEQETIIQQVRARAKYVADRDTDTRFVPNNWRIPVIERGIEALEHADTETLARFEPLYDAIQYPEVDAPREAVNLVFQAFSLTHDDRVDDLSEITYSVGSGDDARYVGPDQNDLWHVIIHVPVYDIDWPFGDGTRFREFLVNHLKCQLRDMYLNMGEEPPEEYSVDGYGKITFHGEAYAFEE